MAGLALVIPRDGPGSGPQLPEPLYTLGVDDYAYRWEASRISNTLNDQSVMSWVDAVAGLDMASTGPTGQTLRSAGENAYVELPGGVGSALAATVDLGDVVTYMIVMKRTGTVANNMFRFDNWTAGVATNGSWQLTGNTNLNTGGTVTADTWIPIFSVTDKVNTANVRIKVGSNAPAGPGSITGPASGYTDIVSFNQPSSIAGTTQIASIVIWKRALTETEMNTVRTNIANGSPLL